MSERQTPATGAMEAEAGRDLPEAERLVSDVETLKAISDPLRLRILEAMVTRPSVGWSAKDLAAELGVPQTRLYHHLELLLERDLVRVAEQRVVSGIIETRYRVAALSLRLDPQLVGAGGAGAGDAAAMIATMFDEVRADITAVLADPHRGDVPREVRPIATRGLARLTRERAAEFRARLEALFSEYDGETDDPSAETYRFLLALYRDPGRKEADHG